MGDLPQQPKQPRQGQPQAPRQQSGQKSAPKPLPKRRPDAEPRNKTLELAWMPFVFCSFIFGLVNILATPVIYVYEIIAYQKKDEWPGWSALDGLNYLFFEKRPLFVRSDTLYHVDAQNLPAQVINLHIPAVTKFLNTVVTGYLDLSVVFVCLLQGVIFMMLAVRISIRVLDKPAKQQIKTAPPK